MNDSTGAMQHFRMSPPRSGGGPEAALVLLYAEGFGALPPAYPLEKKPILMGRDPAADVSLPVTAVSRRHAEVRWERGAWVVRDLGSTNGTLVDGKRVDECALEANSELRVGDAIFKLVERAGAFYPGYGLDGRMRGEVNP